MQGRGAAGRGRGGGGRARAGRGAAAAVPTPQQVALPANGAVYASEAQVQRIVDEWRKQDSVLQPASMKHLISVASNCLVMFLEPGTRSAETTQASQPRRATRSSAKNAAPDQAEMDDDDDMDTGKRCAHHGPRDRTHLRDPVFQEPGASLRRQCFCVRLARWALTRPSQAREVHSECYQLR